MMRIKMISIKLSSNDYTKTVTITKTEMMMISDS